MDREVSGHIRTSFPFQMTQPIPQLALFPLRMPPGVLGKENSRILLSFMTLTHK